MTTQTHPELQRDPAPPPDQLVARILDGEEVGLPPLAVYGIMLTYLPPRLAVVLADEYERASRSRMSPDVADTQNYRPPSIRSMARTAGMNLSTAQRHIERATRAARAFISNIEHQ